MLTPCMRVMKMIRVLETLFKSTMRTYWWSARLTGQQYGINQVKALIHAEIKSLGRKKKDPLTDQRIFELLYILKEVEKL